MLLIRQSLRRVGLPTETAIAAEVRTFNATGTGLVSCGFPCTPGLVTDTMVASRAVTVLVNGAEVPVHVAALRGRFADGSVRSLLLQFDADLPSTTPIAATVVVGRVRAFADPAPVAVTATVILARRVLLATDPVYLCGTWSTFQPLVPDAQVAGNNAPMFTTFMTSRFNSIKNTDLTNGNYQSTYESSRALIARYCMGRNPEMYDQGVLRAYYLLVGYTLPDPVFTNIVPHPNENGLPGVNADGTPAEQHSQRYVSFGVAYLYTGCVEFWNVITVYSQSAMALITTQNNAASGTGWVNGTWVGRFNVRVAWCAALGVILDCNKSFTGIGKWGAGRVITNWQTELQWILDAWETRRYQTGDFRDGLRGNRQTTTNGGGLGVGRLPIFQVALLADFLLFWYLNVQQSATVASWMQRLVDIIWDNSVRAIQAGDEGFGFGSTVALPYMLTETAAQRDDVEPDGTIWGTGTWTMPMWMATLAACKTLFGDAKYTTYLDYARNVGTVQIGSGGLTWSWKIFGEIYGNTMAAPYFDQIGMPNGLPSSVRTPTLY